MSYVLIGARAMAPRRSKKGAEIPFLLNQSFVAENLSKAESPIDLPLSPLPPGQGTAKGTTSGGPGMDAEPKTREGRMTEKGGTMTTYCLRLGFSIHEETACKVSGNHPRCRQCLGQQKHRGDQEQGSPRAERNPEVKPEVLSLIKRLVIGECANYQRKGPIAVTNYCWFREKNNEGTCVFFNQEHPKCTYFERYVLPVNAELEEDYLKGGEGNNGREVKGRPTISRKSPGRSPGGIKVIVEKPARSGVSVGESLRKSILPWSALYGVGPGKPVKGE